MDVGSSEVDYTDTTTAEAGQIVTDLRKKCVEVAEAGTVEGFFLGMKK